MNELHLRACILQNKCNDVLIATASTVGRMERMNNESKFQQSQDDFS